MLSYVGSYEFGGLTAIRRITSRELASTRGFLFVFIVRQRITREDGDECLFQFQPVFVTAEGQIHAEALSAAVSLSAAEDSPTATNIPDPATAFRTAQSYLEKTAELWDWADDIEFLGLSWIEFQ